MTLGEVKIEALRVMGVNLSEDLSEYNIDELLATDKYRSYLVNMEGAINRCFSILFRRGLIQKRVRVSECGKDGIELSELGISDDLAELIPLYIKSELFVTDDYNLAMQALARFEALLAEVMSEKGRRQERVADVMGGLK